MNQSVSLIRGQGARLGTLSHPTTAIEIQMVVGFAEGIEGEESLVTVARFEPVTALKG